MVGRSTLEAIPLHHLHPGGSALRLLARPSRSLECSLDLDICEWARGPDVLPGADIPVRVVSHLAALWGCDVVFLDGLEPLESLDPITLKEHLNPGVTLAARTHGFAEPSSSVDYYLVEDISIITGNPSLRRSVISLVESLKSAGAPFEVHVYTENPYIEELGEMVEALQGTKIPLHVTVYNPRGGGPVKSLYQELRRRLGYVYIHTRIYDEVDTLCPNCGTILLYRAGNTLRAANLRDKSCPKCGTSIPIVGVVRGRTSESLARIARGGVVWYNPLFYKAFMK